jgi:hypothetical protein
MTSYARSTGHPSARMVHKRRTRLEDRAHHDLEFTQDTVVETMEQENHDVIADRK